MQDAARRKSRLTAAAWLALCLIGLPALWYGGRFVVDETCRRFLFYDRAFYRRFGSVRTGIPRAEVIRRLGEPDDRGADFHLSQEHGFEEEYRLAAASASTYYLFWRRDLGITYAVGFGEGDKVTYKALGGT